MTGRSPSVFSFRPARSRVTMSACLLALAAIIATSAGCAFDIYKPGGIGASRTIDSELDSGVMPGQDEAHALPDADAWPDRWPVWSGLRRATTESSRARVMGTIVRLARPVRPMGHGEDAERRVNREQQEDVNLLMSRRRVRVGDGTVRFEGEGPGSFVFAEDDAPPASINAAMYLKFVSGREVTVDRLGRPVDSGLAMRGERSEEASPRARLIRIQRTWFAYFNPRPAVTNPPGRVTLVRPQGIAVVLPGIFGTPENVIDPLISTLRDRGWGVLFMLAHPSRFTEHARFEVGDDTDLDVAGSQIADMLTDRASECAYSVHGAMLYVRQTVPGAAEVPVSIVGLSGGAIVLSTVISRDPVMFQSAVTIAGGADFLGIALESAYTGWINAVRVVLKDGARKEDVARRLLDIYHQHAALDSTRTFGVLSTMPTLMIHANHDRAVPARYGDLAWQLAGKPERWSIGMGHELLFMTLPWHVDRICDWIVDRTPAPTPVSRDAAPPRPQPAVRGTTEAPPSTARTVTTPTARPPETLGRSTPE